MEYIDPKDFPYETLKTMGINTDELQNDKNFINRLSHGMRSQLLTCQLPSPCKNKHVKIRLSRVPDTRGIIVNVYPGYDYLDLNNNPFNLKFSPEEQNILRKYHELGKVATVRFNSFPIECLVGIDTELNCLQLTPKKLIDFENFNFGQEILNHEAEVLKEGGMVLKKNALLYYSNTFDSLCCRTPTPELLMMVKNYKTKPEGQSVYSLSPAMQMKSNIDRMISITGTNSITQSNQPGKAAKL